MARTNWQSIYGASALLALVMIINISHVESIYDPNSGNNFEAKQRPVIREQLRGRLMAAPTTTPAPVQIHSQYSQVAMQRSAATPRSNHFGRSDSNVMRVGKTTDRGQQQQQQQQQEPLSVVPLTRVNARQNYNELPANRGISGASQTVENNQQGRPSEFDEELNEVVQYGTECPPQGTGKFPYIMDCRQYLNCWKGRGYIQSCAPGTMFNAETNECDFPSKVKCGSLNEPSRTSARLESPNIQRVAKKIREPQTAQTISNRFGGEAEAEVEAKCPRRHSGLVEHPVYCDKFLNCANGATYIQDCGPGTVFNPLHKVCDWPYNVDCGFRILFKDAGSQSQNQNGNGGYVDLDNQGQGSNQNNNYNNNNNNGQNNEDIREGKYHNGEGQLDVRMQLDNEQQPYYVHQQQNHPLNAQQYPIYNRPQHQATTTQRNPYAINLPSQSLQPPPIATTEIPRRAFGGRSKQEDQQQSASNWQLPWQGAGQRPQQGNGGVTPTQVPNLAEPEFTPNYNRQYYNQMQSNSGLGVKTNVNQPDVNFEPTDLPMSEALKLLMKPYLSNAATKSNDSNQASQQVSWSSLMAQMTTTEHPQISNEQESMSGGQWTQDPNPYNDSNEAIRPPTTPRTNLPPGHSADWHRRHPHVPMPHQPANGGGGQVPSGHSADWHRRHPNVPMPQQPSNGGDVPPGHSADWHRRHPHVPVSGHRHHHHPNHNRNSSRGSLNPVNNDPIILPIDQRFSATEVIQCPGLFSCNNTKCVNLDQVCDGKNDCGNRLDESNCDHIGYQVRLSNDLGAPHEGRVEVKVYDQWGYVCDDKFGMRDAEVLCKELGFSLGASEVRGGSFYPPNKNMNRENHTVFLMDELDCKGNEKSLSECDFNGWGVHDCNEEEVLGVVCKIPVMSCPLNYWLCDVSQECIPTGFLCDNVPDCADHSDENEKHCSAPTQVRLVNGQSQLEGRVEVKYHGIWGTVCDDDFGNEEAQVVCEGLGYHGPAKVMKNKYGAGTGLIWLDQVNCAGNETSLEDCTHWQWGEHNCGHDEDVGVQCTAGAPARRTTTVRPRYNAGRSNDDAVQYHGFEQQPRMPLMSVPKASVMNNDQCGRIQVRPRRGQRQANQNVQKVINGSTTTHGHHPWQAALRVRGQGKSSHWCGAVLISRFHVLTAAHCLVGFPKGAYFIRFGDYNTDVDERTETEIFIENLYIHEDFRQGTHMNNDLALIVLKAPVRFSDYIQPVCLPQKNAMYFAGMNCTISGWGSIQSGTSSESAAPARELRAGVIPILEDTTCSAAHVYGNEITAGMFCAGTLDEGVDACLGDSGGPLVCESDGVHKLYGIISWGQHCGFSNKPGVYVRVAHYLDWINEKLNHSMTNFGV